VAVAASTRPSRPSVGARLAVRHESTGLALGANDKLRAALLSGVAGYVDAAGLMSLAGIFPAHITGELVSEALALSSSGAHAGPSRLWMLPVFVLSVALAAVVSRLERRATRSPLPALLLLVAVGLGLFGMSGALLLVSPSPAHALIVHLGGCAVVAAMGFQNALMRDAMNGSAPTTFMTGNLTQLVIELVDHAFALGRRPGILGDVQRSVSRARLKTAGVALLAFLVSAALGGLLTRAVGPVSALLPGVLVGFMSLQAQRERRVVAAVSEPTGTLAMRHPTPIHTPFNKLARPESGTRFKAVRPAEDDAKEESA
jgi:uncharacterized membrane protein YoaK (UPF0700 family)